MSDAPTEGLTATDLEEVYDTLAHAIDQAGADRTALFLTKLALLQAQALGDKQRFATLVGEALQDL